MEIVNTIIDFIHDRIGVNHNILSLQLESDHFLFFFELGTRKKKKSFEQKKNVQNLEGLEVYQLKIRRMKVNFCTNFKIATYFICLPHFGSFSFNFFSLLNKFEAIGL